MRARAPKSAEKNEQEMIIEPENQQDMINEAEIVSSADEGFDGGPKYIDAFDLPETESERGLVRLFYCKKHFINRIILF